MERLQNDLHAHLSHDLLWITILLSLALHLHCWTRHTNTSDWRYFVSNFQVKHMTSFWQVPQFSCKRLYEKKGEINKRETIITCLLTEILKVA